MDELEHQPHKRSARNGNRRKTLMTMMQDAGLHADELRNVVRGSMHAQAAEQGSDRPTNGERMPFVHHHDDFSITSAYDGGASLHRIQSG